MILHRGDSEKVKSVACACSWNKDPVSERSALIMTSSDKMGMLGIVGRRNTSRKLRKEGNARIPVKFRSLRKPGNVICSSSGNTTGTNRRLEMPWRMFTDTNTGVHHLEGVRADTRTGACDQRPNSKAISPELLMTSGRNAVFRPTDSGIAELTCAGHSVCSASRGRNVGRAGGRNNRSKVRIGDQSSKTLQGLLPSGQYAFWRRLDDCPWQT